MGDVIHTLPALSDAWRENPNIKFTWLVEEGFSEIPAWHPAVERVVRVRLRDRAWKDLFAKLKEIRQLDFDLVLDAQGLIKSSLIARFCGTKHIAGFSYNACREPLASLNYKKRYYVAKELHAVDRLRQLFAYAIGYTTPRTPEIYNLQLPIQEESHPYLFLLHGTTWDTKHWPDRYWLQLVDLVTSHGYKVKVTGVTVEQRRRAKMLADHSRHVELLPKLSITEAAAIINNAHGVVAVDTGFAHLAAALDKPVVAMYGATDISKSGVRGINSTNLRSTFKCAPCMRRKCNYTGKTTVQPACMQELTPEVVWRSVSNMLSTRIVSSKSSAIYESED